MSGNRITPYKDRTIDLSKPVYIYRNLHSKTIKYSILQKGKVVAHGDAITLVNVKFVVRKAGKKKALSTKVRNVHAFVKGYYTESGTMGTDAVESEKLERPLPAKIKYNPFENSGFFCDNLTQKPFEVKGAQGVVINKKGVWASYTH